MKTSKSSSSCGHARRRQRQWHARHAGFPGHVPVRAVFPAVVVRPAMLGIMAVMNQKDSTTVVVNLGSGMSRVGFTGYDGPYFMFPSGVAKPKMLCILAGMDQIMVQTAEAGVSAVAVHSGRRHLSRGAVPTSLLWQWQVQGWYFWCTLCVCSHRFWQARDARHHGRYGPEGRVCRSAQKTAENPQLQFIKVVSIPVVMQRRIPWSHRP